MQGQIRSVGKASDNHAVIISLLGATCQKAVAARTI